MFEFLTFAGLMLILAGSLAALGAGGLAGTIIACTCIPGGVAILGLGGVVHRLDQLLGRGRPGAAVLGVDGATGVPPVGGEGRDADPAVPARRRYRIEEDGLDHAA